MTVYIETERLNLRDWEMNDLLWLQQLNANKKARQYFPSLLSYRKSELDFHAMKQALEQHQIGLFAVELKATHSWIGFIGLNYIPKASDYAFKELPFYEIGWRLIPEVWENGLATEGALAVLDYAQSQGISEVYAIAAQSNRASIRVMEKIGMSKYDEFEKPKLNAYHPLKKQVRYQKVL
ncbi:N-acetyltransferase [Staphylococcus felis]|uniref:N-acetyltransferase n=3 Tax=Staphylococcus felis TaxID=46127 RepID=A0AAQ0HQ39_9STAP|nr:GNAT family N-acetyltransferase [Staphylococcus felis]AVP35672.1 N-acetyltransferase [Staphylococcus felis]MBH9580788.1 GNAT family N-acetyltransferase [Staphylococcus felis]MDM8327026.1 GNAT family N-acetyltransferase [Staphylococcus felis]MDQ7192535.1 GNAT family N-acetyltransferase [Staphylococcus felis]PNZ38005.1 GNAT family N-acetyltransferase [Staphylococcus felis]